MRLHSTEEVIAGHFDKLTRSTIKQRNIQDNQTNLKDILN